MWHPTSHSQAILRLLHVHVHEVSCPGLKDNKDFQEVSGDKVLSLNLQMRL